MPNFHDHRGVVDNGLMEGLDKLKAMRDRLEKRFPDMAIYFILPGVTINRFLYEKSPEKLQLTVVGETFPSDNESTFLICDEGDQNGGPVGGYLNEINGVVNMSYYSSFQVKMAVNRLVQLNMDDFLNCVSFVEEIVKGIDKVRRSENVALIGLL